jgi:hypothetical protein
MLKDIIFASPLEGNRLRIRYEDDVEDRLLPTRQTPVMFTVSQLKPARLVYNAFL